MRHHVIAQSLFTAMLIVSCRLADAADTVIDFNRDIRPILSKNCFACHGPDEAHRQAGLRLDRRGAAIAGLESGSTAIVPGHADQSELVARITTEDESARMPPAESGRALTKEQVELLRRWVEQGSPYAEHWSFVPPMRAPLPQVTDSAWPANEIDHFVLARLEPAGLKPSPEADRYALARRLSLDLRGLPPTLDEVDEFVGDTQPLAYERLVDRFLADPAYGERWARLWLDQARYADSAGYGSDPLRTIWRYRDWVIDAYNRNLPFDRFTLEQVAGDLLPDRTPEQVFATAFHRNTMTNTEGGTDDEEFRVAAVRDRVDTTFQVWMGLTMGCAKCHNHKYDPITQREYYQFYAFFNQSADTDQPDERPTVPAPTAEINQQLQRIDAQIAELKSQLAAPEVDLAGPQAEWEVKLRQLPQWTILKPVGARSESGAALSIQADGSVLASGPIPDTDAYTILAETDLKEITAVRLEALPHESLPGGGAGRAPDGSFVLSQFALSQANADSTKPLLARYVRIELPGEAKLLSLAEVQVFSGSENVAPAGKATQSSTDFQGEAARAIDGNTDGQYFQAQSTTHTRLEANPWWEVDLGQPRPVERIVLWNRTDGRLQARLAGCRVLVFDESRTVLREQQAAKYPDPSVELDLVGGKSISLSQAAADVSRERFSAAAVLNQKDITAGGWSVLPGQKEPQSIVFILGGDGWKSSEAGEKSNGQLSIRIEHRYDEPQHVLGHFQLFATADRRAKARAGVPAEIIAIVDRPVDERTPEQQQRLADYYRSIAPALQPLRDQIARLEKSRPAIPTLPVMQELPAGDRRETRIMVKGDFLTKGDAVEAAVPAAFHRWPDGAPRSRLGVGLWLVDASNPLTARVAVNRYWAQLFGTGLVETEEDFGTQGELPTHPQLLDWLATEYLRLGWDTKALLRLIVTSQTYRQSSQVTPDRLERDPRNRLFSRGPRFRLEAEMVRDQALALSGLVSSKIGGPSVYPPQPPGLWQAAFNGQRTWATSTGEDRYRRGLYTFWRRTVPYPSMATFDAPSRELCAVRRIRTNTPLQAFVTLNDPVYVEAAQALARRIVREGGSTAEDRAAFALRLCLARPPHQRQIADLVSLYQSEAEHYRADAKAAQAMATEPLGPLPAGADLAEHAAWTVVANILLNMDAVLTKG